MNTPKNAYLILSCLPLIASILLQFNIGSVSVKEAWALVVVNASLVLGLVGLWLVVRAAVRRERLLTLGLATLLSGAVYLFWCWRGLEDVDWEDFFWIVWRLAVVAAPGGVYGVSLLVRDRAKGRFSLIWSWVMRMVLLVGTASSCWGILWAAVDGEPLFGFFVFTLVLYLRWLYRLETSDA